MSYDEREIRVRKNYLEEQNPAICCVCFHSGEELLRELRQQRSVDIVVLSSQLEDMDGYEFLKRLNSLHNRPLLLLQGDDWYSDATASFLLPDGNEEQLRALPCYDAGAIYLQSLSSMLPALVLAPKAGETVLDMAAAPGGKTTQMAALSGGKALITRQLWRKD